MSEEKLCFYAIAKYVPDIIRNEPRNIGVVLFDENSREYKVRFTKNFKGKIGTILQSDKEIIEEYYRFFKELNPSSKDDIEENTKNKKGKFQFSEIHALVTQDLNAELNFLYSTFVEDVIISAVKKHRLKTTLKREFQKLKIIGQDKFILDQEVSGGKLAHRVDFTYQGNKLYAVEAVDLSNNEKRSNTIETAFKFEDLLHGLGKKIETISVIQKSQSQNAKDDELLYILSQFSTVYNYSNGQREAFLHEMENIVK